LLIEIDKISNINFYKLLFIFPNKNTYFTKQFNISDLS
jgi:hypothetical protein